MTPALSGAQAALSSLGLTPDRLKYVGTSAVGLGALAALLKLRGVLREPFEGNRPV